MDACFPKESRLTGSADFMRVMGSGKRRGTTNFVIFAARRDSDGGARLGLAVGRKVGGAVVRNRWKRLIREVFRRKLKGRLAGHDVVVAVKAAKRPKRHVSAGRGGPPHGGKASRTWKRHRSPPGFSEVEREIIQAISRLGL